MPPNVGDGNPWVPGGLFSLLNSASYGAYAVDMNQVIRFWNASAERVLGFQSREVMGKHCYEVLQRIPAERTTPFCFEGCFSLRSARAGQPPQVVPLRIRDVVGQLKSVIFMPLVLPQNEAHPTLLLYLFHEESIAPPATRGKETKVAAELRIAGASLLAPPMAVDSLTVREREVVELLADGRTTKEVAQELYIATNTVRNHIANVRQKLQARSKLEMVLIAQQHGLL